MRWHLIKLVLRLLFTLLFRKDISAARAAFEKPDTPSGPAVALTPLVYDAIKSRLVRGGPVALAIALFAGVAIAGGSFVSYDATTRISQRIKGGTGIDILSGTISATGIAVPISIQPWGNISTAVRGRFTAAGGTSDAAFAAYTSTGRATLTELEAGLATKSPVLRNYTTLVRFGAGPTYNGVDISPGASGSISSSTPTTFALDTILSSTGTLVKGVSIAEVARTGAYADLTGKPAIPAAQVNSNWTASSGIAQILNKPALATVATTGSYTDLSNKPAAYTLPTATTTVLGGVKPDGSSITIDGAGVISSTVSAGVSSFNSRTGVILPATDDYSVAQIAGFADYTTAGGGRVTGGAFAAYTSGIRPSLDLADTALQPTGSGAGLTGITASQVGAVATNADGGVKALYYRDSTAANQAVIKKLDGANGALFFQNYPTGSGVQDGGFTFYGSGPVNLPNGYLRQKVTTPANAWHMFPATQHLIEDHNLGVTGNIDGTATRSQVFAQWLVTASPLATDPAATNWGIINQEINVFNRFGDTGYGDSRADIAKWSVGQQIVPEGNLDVFTGSTERGYNGSFGTVYSKSGNSPNPSAKWHVGTVYEQDSITPAGTHIILHGGADSSTKTNKALKFLDNFQDGIDFSGGTFAGSAIKLSASQTITDGTVTKTLAQLAAGGGTVTDVTAAAPLVSSGGATPAISMPAATDSADGYMTAADHVALTGKVIAPGTTNSKYIPYWSADGSKTLAQTTTFKIDTDGSLYRYNSDSAGRGLYAIASGSGDGVRGSSSTGIGVVGGSTSGTAGYFSSSSGNGVQAASVTGAGIYGQSLSNFGILALQTGALTANNTSFPTFKASRATTLGSYTMTSPVALIEDTTAATGPLLSMSKQSVNRFEVAADGAITATSPATSTANPLNISKDWDNNTATYLMANITSYANANRFVLRRANGSAASPSATVSGDTLGALAFRGYGENTFGANGVVSISAAAEENFTNSTQSTRLVFGTTATGANNNSERMRITGSGNVYIGQTTGTEKLEVTGNVKTTGTLTAANTIGTTTTSAPSTTGTVTINAATTEHYELSPTGTTTQTVAFSGNPASGKVTYVGLRVTTAASGVTTLAWPTVGSAFEWIGDAGATTLTASKGYEYVCRVGAVKTSCKIVQEAF